MVENLDVGKTWKLHTINEERKQDLIYIMLIHIVQENEEVMKMQID